MSAVSCEPVVTRDAVRRAACPRRRARRTLALRRGPVAAGCGRSTTATAVRSPGVWLVELQAVVFVVLVLLGLLFAVPKLVAMTQPDPSLDPVAGDPAWAHVTER